MAWAVAWHGLMANVCVFFAHAQGSPQGSQKQQQGEPPVCVGVGLVRAVDVAKQELYVLTPTPVEELEQVRG